MNGVNKIPEQYILRRWTKVAKHEIVMDRQNVPLLDTSGNSTKTMPLNKLMRKAFSLMNLSANSDATTEIADHDMDNTFEKVTKFNAISSEKDTFEYDGNISLSRNETPILDPPRLRKKGQTYGRMKGFLEKKKNKSRKADVSISQIPQPTNAMTGKNIFTI